MTDACRLWGRLGRAAHLQRGGEPGPDQRRDPGGAARGHAARRRRRLARRHGRSSPTDWRPRTTRVRVRHRAAKQGLGRAYLDGFGVALARRRSIVVQMDADWSHDPTALPSLVGADPRATAPTSSSARATRRGGGVVDWGIGPADHLARRLPLRTDRPRPQSARPDRRLQGVACLDPWRHPVRWRPCRRLRLPDRDDVPRQPARAPASSRCRSRSATGASASPRCPAGSSPRRSRSWSSCAGRNSRDRGPGGGAAEPRTRSTGTRSDSAMRRETQSTTSPGLARRPRPAAAPGTRTGPRHGRLPRGASARVRGRAAAG